VAITGRRDLPLAPEPRGGFEMTVLRMLAFRPAEGRPAPGGGARVDARPAASASRTETANRAAPEPEQKPRSQTVAEESAPAPAVADAPPVPKEAAPAPWRDPDWGGLVDGLGLTGVAHQLAVNSAYLRREGNTLHLQLGSVHAQLKTERSVDRLQEALTRFYREPLKVQINVGDMAADTPAQKQAQRDEARQASARASIERDPNVRGLQEAFGATVDSGSVKPVD
jgi:DNA polymerase-3 subunit gamma/tau